MILGQCSKCTCCRHQSEIGCVAADRVEAKHTNAGLFGLSVLASELQLHTSMESRFLPSRFWLSALLVLAAGLTTGPAGVAGDREGNHIVCSMTLNSSDERDTFIRHLEGKRGFKFVELYQPELFGDQWLDAACASGVECDVLLISGHAIAGDFLGAGDGRPSLPIAKLETLGCSQNCNGIMKNPVETFLFGCNTLPDKMPDERGPEIYHTRLREHGLGHTASARAVSSRYGEWGASIETRYRQAFSQVLHIYGFDSVAPTGPQIQPFLDDYLHAKGDYKAWLIGEQLKIPVGTFSRFSLSYEPFGSNREAEESLGYTNYKECSGEEVERMLSPWPMGMTFESESRLSDRCALAAPQSSEVEREAIRKATSSVNDLLTHIERVEDWVGREKAQKNPIDPDVVTHLKKNLPGAARWLQYPPLVRRLVKLAIAVGSFTSLEIQAIKDQGVRGSLFGEVGSEVKNMYCDPAEAGLWSFVEFKHIPDTAWTDANARAAICCMRPKSTAVVAAIKANGGCLNQ